MNYQEEMFNNTINQLVEYMTKYNKNGTSGTASLGEIELPTGKEFQIQIRLEEDKKEWIGVDDIISALSIINL